MEILTKQPGEKRIVAFEFSARLTGSKTIDSVSAMAVSSVGLVSGSALVTTSGQATVDTAIQIFVDGGTDGEDYLLVCRIVDSDGERHEVDAVMRVLEVTQ